MPRLRQEWVMGMPSGFQFVLRGLRGSDSVLNGTPMGKALDDARTSLDEINSFGNLADMLLYRTKRPVYLLG